MKTIVTLALVLTGLCATAQELTTYIAEAEANNPELQAYRLRYEVAQERVQETQWLPNTELSAGVFVSEPETRTGAQKARFSARQMVPWFGTRTARERYAHSMADAEYQEYEVARRKLALEVSRAYYDLYQLQAQQAVLGENLELLKTYEKLALTALEVGQASAVDVLRLQIRQEEVRERRGVLAELFTAEQARFNALLSRPATVAVMVPDRVDIPEEDPFVADSLGLNPELLRYDRLYESVAEAESLNQKESAPMLGFGVDYVPVQERPDVALPDNGKDILMPMVSLSIPLFDTRFASRTRQNALKQQELQAQKQQRLNTLEAALERARAERRAARLRYQARANNLAQARNAEQILLRSYETGTVDFNDLLEIQELQLKFQLSQIEAVKAFFLQSAMIHYITQ
ncbi:TolC family protein [Robiginitalea sp. M366]|uniref:TolC family protein n=1 Tax=Robiginitalea aestuariiviva TaxID=3036903 RepID=UPI00240D3FC2|nr:TolC family protein [Robiginitalea aestuariiviva]MDG1573381.1 TolC family protein [Robiginitalea aestuariiviva]